MKRFTKFLIICFCFGFIYGYVTSSRDHGFFKIKEIELVLAKGFVHSQFMEQYFSTFQTQLQSIKERNLYEIKLEDLHVHLMNFPWIQEVRLEREWPSKIKIEIIPKNVVGLILGKSGRLVPVLEDGKLMDAPPQRKLPDVPILIGDQFLKNQESLQRAIVTLNSIPREGAFSIDQISDVKYSSKEGFSFSLISENMKVKLGEDQISLKSARVSQVIEYLKNHQLKARVIDANLTKKVLVRLRKDL